MSFGSQRNHLAALILALACLWLTGCSGFGDRVGKLLPAADDGAALRVTAAPWETIEGGLLEGNRLTGLEYVRFQRPTAVALRGQWLYIADGGLDILYRYDLALRRLEQVKDLRDLDGHDITDIYVASDYSYYLADPQGARVLHFSAQGGLIREYSDAINIGSPVAILVEEDNGRLFIADGFNDDVMVFNLAGGMVGVLGQRGDGDGRFRRITDFAAGSLGYYVATRFGEHRVQIMARDGRYATALEKDTVTFPKAIAADQYGRAFVADYLDDTIRVYQGEKLVETIGHHGSAPGQFRRITDLSLVDGRLVIADSLNGRVQILTVPAPSPSTPR